VVSIFFVLFVKDAVLFFKKSAAGKAIFTAVDAVIAVFDARAAIPDLITKFNIARTYTRANAKISVFQAAVPEMVDINAILAFIKPGNIFTIFNLITVIGLSGVFAAR